ncbi:glycosyltransferase family 2 protein [Christensenellaceae bacterium OttesenSCG-928-L17]|nr:glycosyltransferase family 2 protein [Christensenellaceae bacterium OttesenSCG-928-L17]
MIKNNLVLYIVIPCYNEEEVLPETAKRLREKMSKLAISQKSRVVLVDDGSKDRTWKSITELTARDDLFIGLKLSRNRGHQNALLAGLEYAGARADAIISMDADLQDDIGAIDEFLAKYETGAEVVYGVRSERKKDSWFKRNTAILFYKIMKWLGVDIIYNHADYRLMSQRAVKELMKFEEVNLFLRGVVPLIGLKTATVKYARSERYAGKSKYPFRKMLAFAIDGITSFSVKPLKLITSLGIIFLVFSVGVIIYAIVVRILGRAVDGWTFIVVSIWLAASAQMISLGVVGTYVGKIYSEIKGRPRYIVEEIVGEKA